MPLKLDLSWERHLWHENVSAFSCKMRTKQLSTEEQNNWATQVVDVNSASKLNSKLVIASVASQGLPRALNVAQFRAPPSFR